MSNLTIAGVEFEPREIKMIRFSKIYVEQLGAFGAASHGSLVVIQKLATIVEKQNTFATEEWRST